MPTRRVLSRRRPAVALAKEGGEGGSQSETDGARAKWAESTDIWQFLCRT
jgi:hypothetical protein